MQYKQLQQKSAGKQAKAEKPLNEVAINIDINKIKMWTRMQFTPYPNMMMGQNCVR